MPVVSPPILRADAQLQWDYSAQSPANWTHNAIDGNIRDQLYPQVYFIENDKVISLRQFDLSSSNAVSDWIVTDIAFPSRAYLCGMSTRSHRSPNQRRSLRLCTPSLLRTKLTLLLWFPMQEMFGF
jgi:hypothetical protein